MRKKRRRQQRSRQIYSQQQSAGQSVCHEQKSKRPFVTFTLVALLALVTAGVYANSLAGVFVFDDKAAVVDNVYLRHLNQFKNVIAAKLDSPVKGRPLVGLSLTLNYALGGLNTRGYHIFNIAVHICCTLVLFALVRRTLQSAPLKQQFSQAAGGLAFACALLWALHPIQTDTVTYIIQRTEAMMALFYLLTLYCSARSFSSEKQPLWYVAAIACCAVGMTCKEVMVTVPVMVLLYDRTFYSGSFKSALKKKWPLYIGLASTWIVLAALMWLFPRTITVGFSKTVSSFDYLLNQSVFIVNYLKLAFWPNPLVLDYGIPKQLTVSQVIPQAMFLVTLFALTIAALIYRPSAGFLGAWFFIILAPTSSFIPITSEVAAERRMYLPLAAVVVLVVTTGYLLLSRMPKTLPDTRKKLLGGPHTRLGAALVLLAAVALALTTARRNTDYYDELSMWQKSVQAVPDNARAHNNIGLALKHQGRLDEAIAAYNNAIVFESDYVDAHNNIGIAMAMKGRLTEAAQYCQKAIKLDPDYFKAYNNFGIVLGMQQEYDEAIKYFKKALSMNPDYPQGYTNMGNALGSQGKLEEAADNFRRALELNPNSSEAHSNLGNLLKAMGKLNEALIQYQRAIELAPDNSKALNNLALLLVNHPDPKLRQPQKAVELAKRATELTGFKQPQMLATLVSCYAAAARLDDAANTAETALELADAQDNEQLARELREQLKRLRQAKE